MNIYMDSSRTRLRVRVHWLLSPSPIGMSPSPSLSPSIRVRVESSLKRTRVLQHWPLVSVHDSSLLAYGNSLFDPPFESITLFSNDPSLLPIDDMVTFHHMVCYCRLVNSRLQ